MCLLFAIVDAHPRYRLMVAANRDEFYHRPTQPADFWRDAPVVLAGRDLDRGGTWCGVTRSGRWAALTNFRDGGRPDPDAPSRGNLVKDYLTGDQPPEAYIDRLDNTASRYNGYSVLLGTADSILFYSNRERLPRALTPGVYGLSNHLLDTPWPKVARGKDRIAAVGDPTPDDLFHILADRTTVADAALPDTGIDPAWERLLATAFIAGSGYGTRSSTVICIDRHDTLYFAERVFDQTRAPTVFTESGFEFEIRGGSSHNEVNG